MQGKTWTNTFFYFLTGLDKKNKTTQKIYRDGKKKHSNTGPTAMKKGEEIIEK